MADGYSAYRSLLEELTKRAPAAPRFELAACWAHVRRRFLKADPNYPQASEVIDWIRDMYEIEARARTGPPNAIAELRSAETKPILIKIRKWLDTQPALPRSSLGEAITYANNLWPALERFADHPGIPPDNNGTERALRGVVVGRKNHYGSRSLRGTQVAALFYSLIESAKLAGVEPQGYLREATLRAIRNPGTVTLPHSLAAESAAS
jgi:transposase